MQIKIGNILYIGGDSAYHLSSPVQGLESPDIRVGDGLYAGRDGGFVSGHFYGHRTIVLSGFYVGADCEEASELRETLFGLLRIRYVHPIVITTASNVWYCEGVVSNVKADIESLVAGKYQVTLLCPDPMLYRLANSSNLNLYLSKSCFLRDDFSVSFYNNGIQKWLFCVPKNRILHFIRKSIATGFHTVWPGTSLPETPSTLTHHRSVMKIHRSLIPSPNKYHMPRQVTVQTICLL